ncbi:N-acetylmuramic acid 6-phosphate etherase [Ekhidna lutea]|uniref:N-acetylmuramic acid 6-phosphate etherase n=1 Tax=Ekhidna lutea TaxID=447679 RepID=A0A239JZV5_EKHLU|nr:N-acetylmuramic acid 6-phosphate etherase [Ekhidna lutea]SNT11331.1 N-acetylmuramic acid 6-phosphate etherase [Ekhidna lutea]
MNKKPLTESDSLYDHLEKMSTIELLKGINEEDKKVAEAVEKCIPQIEAVVNAIVPRMQKGGRLFYIGAGTSGRLGIVDASECPPTFGVSHDKVIGLIAGGDSAIRKAVEFAEDDLEQGWRDLQSNDIGELDSLIGIAASGRTPYVVGATKHARAHGILTGCITCNQDSKLAEVAEYPIEILVGPEFVTGSTRMKAGTSQKLVLNMISTSVMIKLGHVQGNKMVDMQLSNDKLVERGVQMIMEKLDIPEEEARKRLRRFGTVRKAILGVE